MRTALGRGRAAPRGGSPNPRPHHHPRLGVRCEGWFPGWGMGLSAPIMAPSRGSLSPVAVPCSDPVTVAGAAPVLHRLPNSPLSPAAPCKAEDKPGAQFSPISGDAQRSLSDRAEPEGPGGRRSASAPASKDPARPTRGAGPAGGENVWTAGLAQEDQRQRAEPDQNENGQPRVIGGARTAVAEQAVHHRPRVADAAEAPRQKARPAAGGPPSRSGGRIDSPDIHLPSL